MSNKKKRNLVKRERKLKLREELKLQNKIYVNVLERNSVTVLGQAFLFLFGIGLNFNSVKGLKVKTFLMSWLGKGQFIKFGSLFLIKKTIALGFVVSGLSFVVGYYQKRLSLIPIAESHFDKVVFYPGLIFNRRVEITKNNISEFKYRKLKYDVKFYIYIKRQSKPISFKISLSDKSLDEILGYCENHVFSCIQKY
ncbi:hypothetical protein [Vibrio cionasavignyae]|uniref:hypothetical protein n=1 Tax=Vibrio cionasavignyae TaxID=2910252 RepID=UPI003D109508